LPFLDICSAPDRVGTGELSIKIARAAGDYPGDVMHIGFGEECLVTAWDAEGLY